MRHYLKASLAALAFTATTFAAQAQEVTLRLHHFMSAKANLHAKMLVPFAERVAAASEGRLKIELFDSMSLGGRPGDLFDQAVDGAVDIVLTLPGYTAGRFNQSEVFELPFMMENPVATSEALWDMVESDFQDGEFKDAKILSTWVHGPGVIHTAEPVAKLEDLAGKDVRGPTRLVTDLLGVLGANPVGMPLPAIPENLSKGVINGTVLPWEVTPSIKLAELVRNHTEISGPKALYTATFVLAMNWDSYEALPDDLRAILDAETGKAMATFASEVMLSSDAGGRAVAEAAGNNFIVLDQAEVDRWEAAAQPVYARFIERSAGEGFDGAALIDAAKAAIKANE